jgi:TetR/AcrR family transcriptional regulator, acrAB operon repressor
MVFCYIIHTYNYVCLNEMRRTKKEAEITRQQLLDAALKLFVRKGYAATRLSEIAREVGVTSGAIYWHFGSKQELLIALIKQEVDPYFTIISETLLADMPPLEKIRRLTKTMLGKIREDGKFKDQNRMRMIIDRNDALVGDLKLRFQDHMVEFMERFREVVEAGQAAGQIRTDVSTNEIALFFSCLMTGFAEGEGREIWGFSDFWDPRKMADLLVKAISV